MNLPPRSIAAASAAAVGLTAAWALWPLEPSGPDTPPSTAAPAPLGSSGGPPSQAIAPLDLEAFSTPLWTAPPPPTEATVADAGASPAPAPPPPLAARLLAIITGPDGVRRATLYDPAADRVLDVAAGERIAGATVDAVAIDSVTVTDAAGSRTVLLRPDEPAKETRP